MGFVDLVWHIEYPLFGLRDPEGACYDSCGCLSLSLKTGRCGFAESERCGSSLSKHCFRCIPLGTIGETEMKMNRGCARCQTKMAKRIESIVPSSVTQKRLSKQSQVQSFIFILLCIFATVEQQKSTGTASPALGRL
jgi:hypothetical protein